MGDERSSCLDFLFAIGFLVPVGIVGAVIRKKVHPKC